VQTLEDRRKQHRLSLLTNILSDEEQHRELNNFFDNCMNNSKNQNVMTRGALRSAPRAPVTNSEKFLNSFLVRTMRDMRILV